MEVKWTDPDCMRTAPYVLYVHPALSTAQAQAAKRASRPPVEASPALLDMREAARRLAASGRETFTVKELLGQLGRDGAGWSYHTVRDLLWQEVTWRHDAQLERVRRGWFRLRSAGGDVPVGLMDARDFTAAAVRELAGESPERVVSLREVHARVGVVGAQFSEEAVRRALVRLTGEEPPSVVVVAAGRYRLSQ